MPFAVTPSASIYYEWTGNEQAPVLVLSHWLAGSHELWQPQLDALEREFHILLYDHRGHGKSSGSGSDWTLEDFGKDALELFGHLQLGPVHFCGLSLGGMVGLWLAALHPERIDRLIVSNVAAKIEDTSLLENRMALIHQQGLGAIADNVIDRWFTIGFQQSHPSLVARARQQLLTTSSETYIRTSRAVCDADLTPLLASVTSPSLVLGGDQDRATPPDWTEKIALGIPKAQWRLLAAAHLSSLEASSEYNECIHTFLMD